MKTAKSFLKLWGIIAIIVFIGGYSLYESRNIIRGPIIEIFEPVNGAATLKPLIEIKGRVENISSISINDRQITTDREGIFSEKILLSPGYNAVKIFGQDKFGRHTEKMLELVLTKNQPLVHTLSPELN